MLEELTYVESIESSNSKELKLSGSYTKLQGTY